MDQDKQQDKASEKAQEKATRAKTRQQQQLQAQQQSYRRASVVGLPVTQVTEGAGTDPATLDKILSAIQDLTAKIDLNTSTIKDLGQKVNDVGQKVNINTQAIDKLLQESKETKKTAEEAKERVLAVEEKIPPINRRLDDFKEQFALIELKEKQTNLRIRAVPESEEGELIEFLTSELEEYWDLDPQKEEFKIVSAFRLGRVKRKNRARDCLISLRSREERDKILNLHYQKALVIEGVRIEIFKDIPKYLLDLRANYADLVGLLRKSNIPFRWEFPQGLSFSFKQKKIKIRSKEDKVSFLRDFGEDLRKEARTRVPELPGLRSPDLGRHPLGLDQLEKEKQPPEQEQLLGAVGGTRL